MEQEIKIKDESGDKKYFSQLPHYILNHSTAIDQALYWQMKRYAGEDGRCFATEKTLMQKMGIGKKAYDKALNYLLKRKWIKFIGLTNGKTRPIKTYAIVDIWKLNILHYEEISAESTLSFKKEISAESRGDKCQKQHKISAESNVEEEQRKNNHKEESIVGQADKDNPTGKKINLLIEMFKEVNPSYVQLFKRPPQRQALERMLKLHGREKLEWAIKVLDKTNKMPFSPTITTPIQLENKLGDLIAFCQKEKIKSDNKQNTIVSI